MNFSKLIQKFLLEDVENDSEFAKYMNNEQLKSELLRSNILIGLFGFLAIGMSVLSLVGFDIIGPAAKFGKLPFLFILFYLGITIYELFIRFLVKLAARNGKAISKNIRYGNAFEEASLPTLGIVITSFLIDPIEVLLGPGSFLYFVFILLSALRLDFKLSAFTGLVAAVEYWAVSSYFLKTASTSASISFYMEGSIYPKCGILFITGLITGVVTLEIKKRIRIVFQSMQDQNKILEDRVKARTRELEELNRDLKQRVEKEVKKTREKEQLLVQQSKMSAMGEMISMIAHQWRQPLSSIGAVAGNLKVRYELESLQRDEFNQAIDDINYQTQYLSSTITDFRKFLSPTKKLERADFSEIVENSLKIIGKSLDNKAIKVEKQYRYQQELMTFPNELMQVIINILQNAQDVLMERNVTNPLIKLSGRETNQHLEFTINDNAGGIPNDILKNIFEPYFTTKTKSDGTGLGLYMSRTIIERHCKGRLTASNNADGACFRIELPLQMAELQGQGDGEFRKDAG